MTNIPPEQVPPDDISRGAPPAPSSHEIPAPPGGAWAPPPAPPTPTLGSAPISAPAPPMPLEGVYGSNHAAALAWPPEGVVRDLATFIHYNSYLPVKEVAICAALGIVAGMIGRAFRTCTGKDLALYLILIARSGIGKDAMHEGINRLLELAAMPGAERCIQRKSFASGPALTKALLADPGFLNLQGEFGRTLRGMANPQNTPLQDLRTVMTNAYGKSYLEGRAYSKSEDSMEGVPNPALSFLGETTPGTFLDALTPDMMEDGFLSRFITVSYDGLRPETNDCPVQTLEADELARWRRLVRFGLPYHSALNAPPTASVPLTPDSDERFRRFDSECTAQVNATLDEYERQVWNRAHLKALKVASLLAAADDPEQPQLQLKHAVWAMTLVRRDIETFLVRKRSGDIGADDESRRLKLIAILREYLTRPAAPGYGISDALRLEGVVPRNYLQIRSSSLPVFKRHKLGASAALDQTLRTLVDCGNISELPPTRMLEKFRSHGKGYQILKLEQP